MMCKQQILRLGELPQISYAARVFLPVFSAPLEVKKLIQPSKLVTPLDLQF